MSFIDTNLVLISFSLEKKIILRDTDSIRPNMSNHEEAHSGLRRLFSYMIIDQHPIDKPTKHLDLKSAAYTLYNPHIFD